MVRDTTTEHAVPDPDEPDASLPGEMRAEIKRVFAAGNALVEKRNVEPVPKRCTTTRTGRACAALSSRGPCAAATSSTSTTRRSLHGVGSAFDILGEFAKAAPEREEVAEFARVFKGVLSSGIERIANYFVCCFSTNGDDLGQWRAYADDGKGYALGFDGPALVRASRNIPTATGKRSGLPIRRKTGRGAPAGAQACGRGGENAVRSADRRGRPRPVHEGAAEEARAPCPATGLDVQAPGLCQRGGVQILDLHQVGPVAGVRIAKSPTSCHIPQVELESVHRRASKHSAGPARRKHRGETLCC